MLEGERRTHEPKEKMKEKKKEKKRRQRIDRSDTEPDNEWVLKMH